jgi:hypothetical protein
MGEGKGEGSMKKVNASAHKKSDEARLARLERKRLLRRGSGGDQQWLLKQMPVKLKGSVLADLLEERRSGR